MVSLRIQAVLVFALSFALLFAGFYGYLSVLILQNFSALEQRHTQQNVERVLHALESGLATVRDGKIDDAERKRVEELTGTRFQLKAADRVKLPAVEPVLSQRLGGAKIYVQPPEPEAGPNPMINGYAALTGLNAAKPPVLEVYFTRAIFKEAEKGLTHLRWALVMAGLVLSAVTMLLVEGLLVRRLTQFRGEIVRIDEAQDLALRVVERGRDEFTQVARAFNKLLSSLDAGHQKRLAYEARLQKQNAELVALTQSPTLFSGDFLAALRAITECAARTVEADSSSVWLFNPEGTALLCQDLYERVKNRHSTGFTLKTANYQAYTQAMRTERIIAAHDCRNDPRTKEFTDVYFQPLNITSMLIAPIRVAGQVVGAVCVEHIRTPRIWMEDEQAFVASMGDFLMLARATQDGQSARQEAERLRAQEPVLDPKAAGPMAEA